MDWIKQFSKQNNPPPLSVSLPLVFCSRPPHLYIFLSPQQPLSLLLHTGIPSSVRVYVLGPFLRSYLKSPKAFFNLE